MAFELQDVTNDPDLAESAILVRSSGSFASGGWRVLTTANLPWWGVVNVLSAKQLEALPEADRIHGTRVFVAEQKMYTTDAVRFDGTAGTSDVIQYAGNSYRLSQVGAYPNRGGFYYAIGVRMRGN